MRSALRAPRGGVCTPPRKSSANAASRRTSRGRWSLRSRGEFAAGAGFGRMDNVKTRKERKPLRQTTLDEFTGGDLLVGADAPGATVKPDPQQGDLFRPEARQLRFEMSAAPAAPAAPPRPAPEA